MLEDITGLPSDAFGGIIFVLIFSLLGIWYCNLQVYCLNLMVYQLLVAKDLEL